MASRNARRRPPAGMGIALLLAGLCAGAEARAYDLVALWESRHAASTDTFYTTYYNDHLASLSEDGFADRGVAAWLPCAARTLAGPDGETPYLGSERFPDVPPGDKHAPSRYARGYRAPMNFDCKPPAGAAPLYGLRKGAPQGDHLYTASLQEARSLKAEGYAFRRVEGYVFAKPVAGSTALYRLRSAVRQGGDVEHRYTLSAKARRALLDDGWVDESIAGYAFASYVNPSIRATGYEGTFNGRTISPDVETTVPIRNVVPDRKARVLGGNSASQQYGAWASNVTRRPPGAVWQRIAFKLYSGDIFEKASSLNHIPVFLHYASTASRSQLSALPPYDGIAMVIARSGLNGLDCGAPASGGQLYVEIGQAMGMSCASNLAEPMRSGAWYSIAFYLNDAAEVRLHVTDAASGKRLKFIAGGDEFSQSFLSYYSCPLSPSNGRIGADDAFCENPYSVHGFPVKNTGYMLFPLFDEPANVSAKLSELSVDWLDADMKVLK